MWPDNLEEMDKMSIPNGQNTVLPYIVGEIVKQYQLL